jgi:uncharacterized protein (TIGR00255 family)
VSGNTAPEGSMGESIVGSIAEPIAEPIVEPIVEPMVGSMVEPIGGSMAGWIAGSKAEQGVRRSELPEQRGACRICSMTGYARVASRGGEVPSLTLTLKSINHRFLDLQLRLPAGAELLEGSIRAQLKRELARGHVECTLTLDRLALERTGDQRTGQERSGTGRREPGERRPVATQFDQAALRAYAASFAEASRALGLEAQLDLNAAARLPGMLVPVPEAREDVETDESTRLEAMLAREVPLLLDEALSALKDMRAREGAALAAVLQASLGRLAEFVEEVAALRGTVQKAHYLRIAARLDALLGKAFDRERDGDRVLAEAALLAERGDVEEEIARMQTHIAHFSALLDAGGEAGKKLDFLLQEMNREANTLLSKTTGVSGGGARITECGLAMKAEIEKLREQVQNLE